MKIYQNITLSLDDILLLEAILDYFYIAVEEQQNNLAPSPYLGEFAAKLFREWLITFFEKFNQATLFSCLSAASFLLDEVDRYYLKALIALFNTSEHLAKAVAYKAREYILSNKGISETITLRILANYQARLKVMNSLLAKLNADHY